MNGLSVLQQVSRAPKLILGIGLPGAGKSTFLKNFAQMNKYEYICADNMREHLGVSHNDPLIATDNPKTFWIWDEIRKALVNSLNEGKITVLDATFARVDLRREFIKIARVNGASKIQGVFFDTPTRTAWERSQKRERELSEAVFSERVYQLQKHPPSITDGFDVILTIRNGIISR